MLCARLLHLTGVAALVRLSVADPNSTCYSYGVDYLDDGHYFIWSNSNETFTCVSTFQGCNAGLDPAEILFVDPDGDEYVCSEVQTTPANTPILSTCHFTKNEMMYGLNMILVIGKDDDGIPFAWERDIYLTVGPQATTTMTSTITFSITSTPVVTSTITYTLVITTTTKNSLTITVPSAAAKKTMSITRTRRVWTKSLIITTTTSTATCMTPAPWMHRQDKPCTYSPTLIYPAVLETLTGSPGSRRILRKHDRAVSVDYARARINAAKARRDQKAKAAQLDKRAPDLPTITANTTMPMNATVTITGNTLTTIESTAISTTSTITLPSVTVYSGVYTAVTTLPTPTKTRLSFVRTTTTSTKIFYATFTKTVVVTLQASLKACRQQGGYYWNRWD